MKIITEAKLLYKVSKLSLKTLLVFLALTLFGFSFLYLILDANNGLKSTVHENISFGDCLYYSIITFTTLGYGDFYPVGLSKVLSAIEVVLGVAFFGMLVSKLTAAKSDYILHRLYSSEVQRRLLEFDTGINQFTESLKSGFQSNKLNEEFVRTQLILPGNDNFYEKLLSLLIGMRKYIGYEVYYGEIFRDISRRSLYRVLNSSRNQLNLLNNLSKKHDLSLNDGNKKRLERIVKSYFHSALIIKQYWSDDAVEIKCSEVMRLSYKFNTEVLGFTSLKYKE
jgi:hypothetical protein